MQPTGNIFLVGLMGAGKTTVGKLLAKQLGKTFIDSDHEIERRTGASIPLIFELEGEKGFRERETNILKELTSMEGIVLATGGGAVVVKENRDALSNNGTVVYLRASIESLWQRTQYDKNRPLLRTPDPKARLKELYEQRNPLYCEIADIIVDSGHQNVRALVRDLEKQIQSL